MFWTVTIVQKRLIKSLRRESSKECVFESVCCPLNLNGKTSLLVRDGGDVDGFDACDCISLSCLLFEAVALKFLHSLLLTPTLIIANIILKL